MESYGSLLLVQMDLEPEERAAPSFQLNPFDQLIGVNLFGVHLQGIAVRQFVPFLNRVSERLDEPFVARPFQRRYSIDVAGEPGRNGFISDGQYWHVEPQRPSLRKKAMAQASGKEQLRRKRRGAALLRSPAHRPVESRQRCP